MPDFSIVSLDQIAVHKVGNKFNDEDLVLSHGNLQLKDEVITDLLAQYFLKPFKQDIYFQFQHPAGLDNHPLHTIAKELFTSPEKFFDQSINIATHLYEMSNHPNIKDGELYLTYLKDCKIGEDHCDAIGIFKSESKETFLKVFQKEDSLDVDYENGVNINKLDKGCLIFNMEEEQGYRICAVDNNAKSTDIAQFWQLDFLQVQPREDQFFHTQNYLNLCKDFCEDVFTPDNDIDRTEQINMLKNSVDYFNNNEQFSEHDFESKVIQDPGVIDAFQNYKEDFIEKNDVPIFNDFDISKTAVSNNKKFFKSILKLDKKFSVYVHGGNKYMERGFDEERKMNYYKLFFDEEA